MITVINALQQVTGSEIILSGILMCIAFSTGFFMLGRANRNKKAVFTYLGALLIILELCDFIWFSYFFQGGDYLNRGVAGVRIFTIFPILLIALNIALTLYNKHKAL